MLLTTTNNLESKEIIQYFGIVSGETIIGANIFKDIFAGIRDIVGGRASAYESVLHVKDLFFLWRITDSNR